MTWLERIKERRAFSSATAWQRIDPDADVVAITPEERDRLVAIAEAAERYDAATSELLSVLTIDPELIWEDGDECEAIKNLESASRWLRALLAGGEERDAAS